MIRYYRKKVFLLLTTLALLFSTIFLIALLHPSFLFFDIGLPAPIQNKIIAFLSFLCLLLVLWDMKKI